MRPTRPFIALLFALVLALPASVAAQAVGPIIGATSVYQGSITADAAAWTDATIASGSCVTSTCITGGQATDISFYNAGSDPVRILLRGEDGEAAAVGFYLAGGAAWGQNVFGANVKTISIHGDGNTPTVYWTAGTRN